MNEAKNQNPQKLSQDIPLDSLSLLQPKRGCDKKRIRRIAEPHLQAHRVRGRLYYTYRRGIDPEIYLGSADAILKAVKERYEQNKYRVGKES